MRNAIYGVALLILGCASAKPAQPRLDPHRLDACTIWEDSNGSYTLPDPCRYEVAPGEWLAVRTPRAEPSKRHSRLWWLLTALLVI
jgi:hypothetical protein